MNPPFSLVLDKSRRSSLAEQIRIGIVAAIDSGVLLPGSRLPSWRDLAVQLGVARGTVRSAYERLQDAQLIVAAGAAGTHVSSRLPHAVARPRRVGDEVDSLPDTWADFSSGPGMFQLGVPALDEFPSALFGRIRTRAARSEFAVLRGHPDPRGEAELRREIAAHVALSRSIECVPAQVIVTSGFSGALGLVLHALRSVEKPSAWIEEPGYPLARRGLGMARLDAVPVPVDGEGMIVGEGIARAPDAGFAIVTPGQQAPLGGTLSLARRSALLDWANDTGAWIVEDDYLGPLQLSGRAAPALAAMDRGGRVIHIGSFSKTLSPALRLGFLVVPPSLAATLGNAAACLGPAPGPAVQLAVATFMRDGHYLRHLRRMKRLYAQRRDRLKACLDSLGWSTTAAGLAMLLDLPPGCPDTRIAREAAAFGLTPSPLSQWYGERDRARSGLLLGITAVPEAGLDAACERLCRIVDMAGAWERVASPAVPS